MNPTTAFDFQPVDISNWKDLENLFESRGGPHNCWCMVWRKGKSGADKAVKKASLKALVENQLPIGLLAYRDSEPVAWCSVAPRETYRKLGGDPSKEKVWSLVCFFIKRDLRGRGLTNRLLEEAMKYAKTNGAEYLEAYPVLPDSPSYRFMGLVPMFEKAGFEFVHEAGKRRKVMLKELF